MTPTMGNLVRATDLSGSFWRGAGATDSETTGETTVGSTNPEETARGWEARLVRRRHIEFIIFPTMSDYTAPGNRNLAARVENALRNSTLPFVTP